MRAYFIKASELRDRFTAARRVGKTDSCLKYWRPAEIAPKGPARKANCGANIGKMLLATSLAKQPDFREKVRSSLLPFFYFCGERDQKFRQMAEANQLNLTVIPDAGHNAHLENPIYFAKKIENIVLKIAQP